ncbi:MAG TPA: hypothetical protein VJ347_00835 [Streptosporangiaceae bacterium]|nr:hypothetical protein [Streptosporangiaceae bacterium]
MSAPSVDGCSSGRREPEGHLRDAFLGVTRFDQFQEHLGISRNILRKTLPVPGDLA